MLYKSDGAKRGSRGCGTVSLRELYYVVMWGGGARVQQSASAFAATAVAADEKPELMR